MLFTLLALSSSFVSAPARVVAPFARVAPVALVGPPILCQPFDIGDAPSLPWGGKHGTIDDYDRSKLAADVAQLLRSEPDLLVHMETLRRATFYVENDRALAWQLVGRCALTALDAARSDKHTVAATFDLAFLIGCMDQMGIARGFHAGVAHDIEGYGYMLAALQSQRAVVDEQTGVIEFAAALMTHPAMGKAHGRKDAEPALQARYDAHMQRALRSAPNGSWLEKNIATHLQRWGSSIERVRAQSKQAALAPRQSTPAAHCTATDKSCDHAACGAPSSKSACK